MRCETLQKLEKEQQPRCEKPIKGNGFFGTAFLVLIALAFFGLGSLFLIKGIKDAYYGHVSNDWPMTEGFVKSVFNMTGSFRGFRSFVPIIQYTYEVDGEEYQSDNWRFDAGYPFYDNDIWNQVTLYYHVDKMVNVYYHPKKPQLSVLEPGFRKSTLIFLMLATVLIAIGSLILRFSRVKYVISAIPEFPIHIWRRGG